MSAGRRLLLVPIGLTLAIPAGGMFLIAASVVEPSARAFLGDLSLSGILSLLLDIGEGQGLESFGIFLFGTMLLVSSLLIAPLVLVVVLGEALRLRSYVWYSGFCGALTASVPWAIRAGRGEGLQAAASEAAQSAELRITLLLFLTGVVSGFVYWLVAGRSAGPEDPAPADS